MTNKITKENTGLLSAIFGGITALFILVCPICYALPLLLVLGLGSIVSPFAVFGQWFILLLILISLIIFLKDYKQIKSPIPLIFTTSAIIVFIAGRFLFDFDPVIVSYIAGGLVACATIINYYKLKKICKSCRD